MSVAEAERALRGAQVGTVRRAEPMARHTTFRIGGPADLFVICDTIAELSDTLGILQGHEIPWTLAGRGSNLLVADWGYRGAVLTLGREFKAHSVEEARITAGAACVLAYVVQDAFSKGLGGLEFAVGIPGTLGGALAMNAGSREVWMGSVTESVTLLVPDHGLTRLRSDEIAWGYRKTDLSARGVIVEAVIGLEVADRDRIRSQMEASLRRRKATQPIGASCAGSVFANPPGDSAGRLIEGSGLKGTRLGGARVSDVHANFIVNDGGATAADVVGLMRKIQVTVRDTYGIGLTPEVRFLGSFDEP